MKELTVSISKKGLPCLWECGGGYSNTGETTIIADVNFKAKMPIYVRQSGQLANGNHALIPVKVGDHVIEVYRHRNDFRIWIYKIIDIDIAASEKANVELVYEFSDGEWNQEPPVQASAAIDAAKAKALDYHCRKPYFIQIQ